MNNLLELESEAIYVIREAFANLPKGVILFSGGKDSIVLTHIAMKAFYPLDVPFDLLHIDTGYNFEETLQFRDQFISKYKLNLLVGSVQSSLDNNEILQKTEKIPDRNALQSHVLLKELENNNIDFALGGARRDEERARSKERFFSHRNEFNSWDPKNQRPELWYIFNCRKHDNENFRVFPLSNWTELDIWEYIKREDIELPSLYFSHQREVFKENGIYLSKSSYIDSSQHEFIEKQIRFRTLGDITTSGAIESKASNVEEIIEELKKSTVSERGNRFDDQKKNNSLETRKQQGYF